MRKGKRECVSGRTRGNEEEGNGAGEAGSRDVGRGLEGVMREEREAKSREGVWGK